MGQRVKTCSHPSQKKVLHFNISFPQTSTFVGKVKKSQVHTARSGNLGQSLGAVDLLDTPADFTFTEKILKFQMKNSLGSLVWSARSMQRYFKISLGN